MTERPMWDAGPGEHPDEGTIHAWLDGALDSASAERVAAHVRGCSACATLVAEARGLIAGASRVVSALDDVPAGTRPGWAQGAPGAASAAGAPDGQAAGSERSLWRRLRVTPTRAAIAATILVALGVTLTHDRVAVDSVATLPAGHSQPRSGMAGAGVAGAPSATAEPKDAVLDSAVARNLSIAQGTPSVEAARSPAIPQAPVANAAPVGDAPVAMAEERVAAGRAAIAAQRETAGAAPDRLRVRGGSAGAADAREADQVVAAAPAREESGVVARGMSSSAAKVSQSFSDAVARSCYSLDSQQSGAMWGDQPLPLVIVVDSGPPVGTRSASVRSGATGTAVRASWLRTGTDSVVITLERVGMSGTVALGPDAGGRAGTATSGAIVAARKAAPAERSDAGTARARSAAPAPAASASAPSAPPSGAGLRVTLRPIDCATR